VWESFYQTTNNVYPVISAVFGSSNVSVLILCCRSQNVFRQLTKLSWFTVFL